MEDNIFLLTGKMVEKSGQAETCFAFQLTGKRPWNLSSNFFVTFNEYFQSLLK